MFDAALRARFGEAVETAGAAIARLRVSGDALTAAGVLLCIPLFIALAQGAYGWALLFLVLNRLMDLLDGPVARACGPSPLGGYFDICSDYIFYGGFVFFFALGQAESALAAAFLLFSFVLSGTSFLAFAILAARHGWTSEAQGRKSFFYQRGLAEGAETFVVFVLMALLPQAFAIFAVIFGLVCVATAVQRAVITIATARDYGLLS
jgi:phosphatidylglycerophosphate synthase